MTDAIAPEPSPWRTALLVGVGPGLGTSLARAFKARGMGVAVAAREAGKLAALQAEGMEPFSCDASDEAQVRRLFGQVEASLGAPDVVVYNAGARVRGPIADLAVADVQRVMATGALGAFHVAQEAVRRMLPAGRGALLFTGASASVKGYAQSAPFAMAKFAVRGLAQSLARELAPQGIHVAHFVIDGTIRSAARPAPPGPPDAQLDPDAIAASYLHVLDQPRSAWTWEVELRPWVERF